MMGNHESGNDDFYIYKQICLAWTKLTLPQKLYLIALAEMNQKRAFFLKLYPFIGGALIGLLVKQLADNILLGITVGVLVLTYVSSVRYYINNSNKLFIGDD